MPQAKLKEGEYVDRKITAQSGGIYLAVTRFIPYWWWSIRVTVLRVEDDAVEVRIEHKY